MLLGINRSREIVGSIPKSDEPGPFLVEFTCSLCLHAVPVQRHACIVNTKLSMRLFVFKVV